MSLFRNWLTCASLLLLAAGCTSYYQVTDPHTGRVYYTTDVDTLNSGATSLKDARTGHMVTVQNSEVKKISKEEFETGKHTPPVAPPPGAKEPGTPG